MKLLSLHQHLDYHNCDFLELTGDYNHAIYVNTDNGRRVSIPKYEDDVCYSLVLLACYELQIPAPGTESVMTFQNLQIAIALLVAEGA